MANNLFKAKKISSFRVTFSENDEGRGDFICFYFIFVFFYFRNL